MVSAQTRGDFPWYQHQVEFDPPPATQDEEIVNSGRDVVSQAYPHPLVQSRSLYIELDEEVDGLDSFEGELSQWFGKVDLQLTHGDKAGLVWFESVRQAEKALVCHPGISSTFPTFHLLPMSTPPIMNPLFQPHVRVLRGFPDSMNMCSVYDLIRPWGCLSRLDGGNTSVGLRDWMVSFFEEKSAASWEKEWSGITFEGQVLSITFLKAPFMNTPKVVKFRQNSVFPLTPPPTIRRRRASIDTSRKPMEASVSNETDSRGRKTFDRRPGWIAEFHGSVSHNASNLLFTPLKRPEPYSRRRSSNLVVRDGAEWVTLRCSNVHPDVSSAELNQFLKEESCSALSVRLLHDRQRRSRGQAILTYEDWEAAARVLRKLQGALVRSQALDITYRRGHVSSQPSQDHEMLDIGGKLQGLGLSTPSGTSDRDDVDKLSVRVRAGVINKRDNEQIKSLVDQATQTGAIPASIDGGIQTERTPLYVSVECQASESRSTRSIGCQSRIPQYDSIGSQTEQKAPMQSPLPASPPDRPSTDLERRWLTLPLIEPSTFPELALYPAQAIWIFLFRSSKTIRKMFSIRDPDGEMQALTLDWLGIHDEETLREHLEARLVKLLRAWGYREHSASIATRYIRAEDPASVLLLMNVYPAVLREMMTRQRRRKPII